MKTISALGLILAFSGVTACGSAVLPPELASARSVYDRAAAGPAASLNPTDLHTAKESLDAANQSFEKDGDSQVTRDLGYAAQRSAETAESRARTLQAKAETEQVIARMHATTETQGKQTAADRAVANQQLAPKDQALLGDGVALAGEVSLRKDAKKRAAQATADLAKFA